MRTALCGLSDWYDESHAQRLRQHYGPYGWLVSWTRLEDGRWLARLSCPNLPETIERIGRSRCEAITQADKALREELELRTSEEKVEKEPS